MPSATCWLGTGCARTCASGTATWATRAWTPSVTCSRRAPRPGPRGPSWRSSRSLATSTSRSWRRTPSTTLSATSISCRTKVGVWSQHQCEAKQGGQGGVDSSCLLGRSSQRGHEQSSRCVFRFRVCCATPGSRVNDCGWTTINRRNDVVIVRLMMNCPRRWGRPSTSDGVWSFAEHVGDTFVPSCLEGMISEI